VGITYTQDVGNINTNFSLFGCISFRNHSHGEVKDFIGSNVEFLKNLSSGRLQDKCSYVSTALPNNNSHEELEASMVGNILMPTAAVNGDELIYIVE
jgi:hypothetical protein